MDTVNEAQLKVHKHLASLILHLAGEEGDDETANDFADIIRESMNLEVKEVHKDGSYTVTVSLNPNFSDL